MFHFNLASWNSIETLLNIFDQGLTQKIDIELGITYVNSNRLTQHIPVQIELTQSECVYIDLSSVVEFHQMNMVQERAPVL